MIMIKSVMKITKEAILLSGTDGIITVFNLLVGLNVSHFTIENIFKIVVIAIVGDAISMGISYYNSKDGFDGMSEDDRIYGAIANIIGSMCLMFFLLIASKPSLEYAYLSIIVPLFVLSMFEDSDIKMTIILGLLGSTITYFVSRIVK